MKLIIDGFGKTIHKQDNHIIIKDNDKIIYDDLAEKINSLTIMGKGHITFDAITLLTKNNVNIISINYYTNQTNYIINSMENQTKITTLKKQVYYSDNSKSIQTAQEIIKSKIKNQIYTLKTLNKQKNNIQIDTIIKQINTYLEKVDDINDKEELLGLEGITSKNYWKAIKNFIPEEYEFENRSKKPAKDLINAMLNYGYSILASQITNEILKSGLNPDIGILHKDLDKRHSLTYDIIEEFRQQIVDKSILSLIHNKQIKIEDYQNQEITLEKRKIIISKIIEKLETEITYNNEKITYHQIIEKQINKLKNTIIHDEKYTGFYNKW